jgi:murein DD-endopeptidase MepM/ murein hydrolase activator NlpD
VGARIDTTQARLRLRPTTVRRLRIAAASSLVVLFVLGGAGLLWLAMRASEPRPAESPATQSSPPVRLDTLPDRSSGTGRASGVPSSEMRSERGGARAGEATADQRVGQGGASAAEMRREVAALARENARVQAALSGYQGANPGTGEIVPWIDGPVLYRFGWPGGRRHAGIDIRVRAGTPVHAADSGRVVLSGVIGGYGKYVCVQHTQSLSTCYAHNSRLRASEGEKVHHGDVIALSGCSGRCYGEHIHFEVRANGRPVNPRPYF